MKRVLALFCPALFLAGCVTVPYDTGTGYYAAYPATVSVQASSAYYYPGYHKHAYPYASPPYSRPYPSYPSYPSYPYQYQQPPAYVPPAAIIAPPPVEFRYERNMRPGTPHRHWQHRNTPPADWQWRDSGSHEWRGNSGRQHWRRHGPHDGRHGGFGHR